MNPFCSNLLTCDSFFHWQLLPSRQKWRQSEFYSKWLEQISNSEAPIGHTLITSLPQSCIQQTTPQDHLPVWLFPGYKAETKLNPPPGAIATKHFTVVWFLYEENMALCSVRELGTSVKISKQSIMALTLGKFNTIDSGMCSLTISGVGQIGIDASLRYMKFSQVMTSALTLATLPLTNQAKCSIEKLRLNRQSVRMYDLKGVKERFLPRVSSCFFGWEFVVVLYITTFSPLGPGSKYS